MNLGVLKNRLLNATSGEFNESAYGYKTFQQFVLSMPDLLELDNQRQPPVVTLREGVGDTPIAALKTLGQRARIREDLWNAIMDYSRGTPWIWIDGEARPCDPCLESDQDRIFPTVTPEILGEWRSEFLGRLETEGIDPDTQDRIDAWRHTGALTFRLPGPIRQSWNASLKGRVLDRLEDFFRGLQLELPANALVEAKPADHIPASNVRAYLNACIAVMNDDELAAIPIPAGVIARAASRFPGRTRTDG